MRDGALLALARGRAFVRRDIHVRVHGRAVSLDTEIVYGMRGEGLRVF